jgi:tRNA nucleotidyltransferase (CCA-adding enzyme)
LKIKLPATVKTVLDSLHAAGYEAYAVGGCVRDSILGRQPDDWDITTSARPDQVKQLFRRTVDTGIQHGTVTVLVGSGAHEVTTYRIDGKYADGRHPDQVTFTASLEEDLKRRDFTINAMAYSQEEGLIDLYGGIQDLQRKMLRCVGNPMERFAEDALRILRAVRFSAQLSLRIDPETERAIEALAPSLSRISAERICTELLKLITSGHPDYLERAWRMGITRVILPEFDKMMETPQNNPHHCYNVGRHTLQSMCQVRADKVLRLTMLLHDVAKPDCHTRDGEGTDHFKGHAPVGAEMARGILRRLKLDNDTIHQVVTLVKYHDWRMEPEERQVRRAANKVGTDLFPLLREVQMADALAQSDFHRQDKLQRIEGVWVLYEKILQEGQCISLKELKITGQDVLQAGLKPGPEVGEVLKLALEDVLEEPGHNNREYLLNLVRTEIAARSVNDPQTANEREGKERERTKKQDA